MKYFFGLIAFSILGLFLVIGIDSIITGIWWRAILFLGLYELFKISILGVFIDRKIKLMLLKLLNSGEKKG